MSRYTWLLIMASALATQACSGGGAATTTEGVERKPDGEGRAKLWLSSESKGEDVTVRVKFEKGSALGPRVAEIRLAHSLELTLASTEAGGSSKTAGKELTVQEPEPNLVRLVLLSRDGSSLDSGELAVLKFRKQGTGKAKIDILMDKPVFAPAEAMQGLSIGDPIEL